MASEFFADSNPEDAAKKEEERLLRSMGRRPSGKVVLGKNPPAQTESTSWKATNPPPTTVSTSPPKPSSSTSTSAPSPVAVAPISPPHPSTPTSHVHVTEHHTIGAPSGPSPSLFARAATNAAQGSNLTANHPAPARLEPPVETSSVHWGESAEESARKEEERMRKMLGSTAISKTATKEAETTKATAPVNTTQLPEPYHPNIVQQHTPAPQAAATSYPNMPTEATIGGPFEREIFNELNKARTNPQAFAKLLREYEHRFHGNMLQLTSFQVQMRDGVAGVREAAELLERMSPIPHLLTLNLTFSKSALDLVRDHGPKGSTGDQITDSTAASTRLVQYGVWKRKVIETTAYMPVEPRDVVALWLVDDGTPGRVNRASILDPSYRVVGIASGPHAKFGRMIVVDWTEDYTEGHVKPAPAYTYAPIVPSTSESAQVTEHKTGVLVELSDGSGFLIDVGDLGVPKSNITVVLRNGTEINVARTQSDKVTNFKYQLPFAWTADRVSAELTPAGRLQVKLRKPSVNNSAANEVLIGQYNLGALNPAKARVEIEISESKDHLLLKSLPSKHAEEVTVKLRDGKVIVWESKHTVTDDEGEKVVTSTQTLKLPFEVAVSACNVVHHGSQGATTQVAKPRAAASEVQIPIN